MDDEDLWPAADIPMTVGSLVAQTFRHWLNGQAEDPEVLELCVRKLGTLDPSGPGYRAARRAYQSVVARYRDRDRLREDLRAATGPPNWRPSSRRRS